MLICCSFEIHPLFLSLLTVILFLIRIRLFLSCIHLFRGLSFSTMNPAYSLVFLIRIRAIVHLFREVDWLV